MLALILSVVPVLVVGSSTLQGDSYWSSVGGCWIKTQNIMYCTYYKPMGDLPYISSEQGDGQITIYKHLYLYKNFELKRGWAYNTYYTKIYGTMSGLHNCCVITLVVLG